MGPSLEAHIRYIVADRLGVDPEELTADVSLADDLAADSLDLMVATNYAVMAADLALEGASGRMVALRSGTYTSVPISATREGVRRVDVDELYDTEAYRPKVRHVAGKPMFLY